MHPLCVQDRHGTHSYSHSEARLDEMPPLFSYSLHPASPLRPLPQLPPLSATLTRGFLQSPIGQPDEEVPLGFTSIHHDVVGVFGEPRAFESPKAGSPMVRALSASTRPSSSDMPQGNHRWFCMHLALKSTGEQGKKGRRRSQTRRRGGGAEEEEDPDEEFLFAQLGSKGAFEPSVRREASVASPRSSVAESRTASAASGLFSARRAAAAPRRARRTRRCPQRGQPHGHAPRPRAPAPPRPRAPAPPVASRLLRRTARAQGGGRRWGAVVADAAAGADVRHTL